MEKRLKLGISRIFRSSLRSCKSHTLSDVAKEPVFLPRDSRRIQSHPSNPPHSTFPSLCRPKSTKTIIRNKPKFQNRRSSPSDTDGRRCPPPSPASPFNSHQLEETEKKIKAKKFKGKEIVDTTVLSTSSDSRRFFSSDEEMLKETEPLFSSDSSSSISSSEYQRVRRRKAGNGIREVGFLPKARKFQESVAVVKSSDDPYGDFKRSMVEMIIENQMYTADDLEQLLGCFLSLNSPFHHQVIVEVFSEILEAIFPNCS
ncbi:transcription repressor OFP8-like [Magnolia sinica]|uniref:transcription repressor OFP8-like n=1 Tax=Magnolia sinica TaxID=86752 RepID=UPI00265A8D67|nr:transcription repressor OFP8-like [Magnolia sinica]